VQKHNDLFLIGFAHETTCRVSDSGLGAVPESALSLVDVQRDEADVTITNRTWFSVKFTLGVGLFVRTYVLRPTESFSGRDLGGQRITFRDGRGWSSMLLQAGQSYQFVERGGLFLLEKTV
jgi:hypothetical protein